MYKRKLKTKILLAILNLILSFLLLSNSLLLACCGTQERVEVPPCFLIDKDPKIKENIDSSKSILNELKTSFMDAAMVVENIESHISAADGDLMAAENNIRREITDAKTRYNNLREKLGARREASETRDAPSESSLIGKLRELFDKYKVKKDGQFKPRLEECKKILNSLARTANVLRAQIGRLKFEDTRTTFRKVNSIAIKLLEELEQSVENINLSINEGVCLWEVGDDTVSDTSIEPKTDAKKKRLPVGTKVRTKAKQREATNELNPGLTEINAHIADPDQCKFHHIHGKAKSKEDPDMSFCGHGSVSNTDIECPNCPKLLVESIKIPENLSEGGCYLFAESEMTVDDPRLRYQGWIKQLICTYFETDFTSETNIETFAATVFSALENNIPTLGKQNIIHIVAKNPAVNPRLERSGKPKPILLPTIVRSLRDSTKTVVGIVRAVKSEKSGKVFTLFGQTKPAKSEEEQRKLTPFAENAIISLFSLKKAADIYATKNDQEINQNIDGFEGSVASNTIQFKNDFLPKSEINKASFSILPFEGCRPSTAGGMAGSCEAETERDDTSNLFNTMVHVEVTFDKPPKAKKKEEPEQFKVNEIPPGSPLGITVPFTGYFPPIFESVENPNVGNLESIEPLEKFIIEDTLVKKVLVRTGIHMFVASGRPVFVKLNKDLKPPPGGRETFDCKENCLVVRAIKVVANDGMTDLTKDIRTHELKHVSDNFIAFKEQVIDKVKERLNDSSLDEFVVEKKLRIKIVPGERGNAFDIIGTYILKERASGSAFEMKIKTTLNKATLQGFINNYKIEKERKAAAFHATPAGQGLTGDELPPVNDTTLMAAK